jgi:hypothetical protein
MTNWRIPRAEIRGKFWSSRSAAHSGPLRALGAAFDVARPLELVDRLRHRLLAYLLPFRELADPDAFRSAVVGAWPHSLDSVEAA